MRVASILIAVLVAVGLGIVAISWAADPAIAPNDPLQSRLQKYRGALPLAAPPAALPAVVRPGEVTGQFASPAALPAARYEGQQMAGESPSLQDRLRSARRSANADMQPEDLAPQAVGEPTPAASPSDDPNAPRRFSVLRRDENQPAEAAAPTTFPTPRALPRPSAAGTPTPASDRIDPRGSSRRVASLPAPTETVTPRPIAPPAAATTPAESLRPAGVATLPAALPVGSVFNQQGAALGVEMVGPKAIVAGKPTQYTLRLSNTSENPADEVVVFVAVPVGVEIAGLQSTVGAARVEGQEEGVQRIRWSLDRAAPRSQEQMSITLLPKSGDPIALEAGWTCRPSFVQTQIDVLVPKLEVAVTGPSEVQFGETAVYTLVLTNPGTGDAENVVVQLAPLSPTQPATEPSRIGTIRAGEKKQLEVELTAREAGMLNINVTTTADSDLRAEASHQVSVRRAKLEIAADGPRLLYTGSTAVYAIRVVNSGDAAAENVLVEAALPNGATLESASDGGRVDERGRAAWTLGTLRPGQQRVVEIRCLLSMAGQNRIEIATAGAGQLAATAAVVTEVESVADLKLTVNDPTGPLPIGKNGEFEIRIVNRGAKAAEMINVRATFAPGVEALSATGGRSDITGGNVAFAPIARILPDQEIVLSVTARGLKAGNHVFRVEVTCRDPETNLVSQETTRFYGEAVPGPSLAYPPAAGGVQR